LDEGTGIFRKEESREFFERGEMAPTCTRSRGRSSSGDFVSGAVAVGSIEWRLRLQLRRQGLRLPRSWQGMPESPVPG